MGNAELFEGYRRSRSEKDLAALVASQVDLAYSVALRRVRDVHLAEDVTQAVFILFVKKVAMLPAKTNIAGWIFRTTQYVAANALRKVRRRARWEQGAKPGDLEGYPGTKGSVEETQEQMATVDGALLRLGKKDQEAVLMKYYQGRSWEEVGAAMGISEEAARKRIARALGNLREAMEGETGSAMAGGALPVALMAHAIVPAPAHVTAEVMAQITAGVASHSTAYALAKGATMAMKAKWAATAAAMVMLVVPVGAVVVHAVSAWPGVQAAASAEPAPFTVGERTTRILGPLRADGTVDYVAALNERYGKGLTKERNGFAQWLELVGPKAIGVDQALTLWAGNSGGMWQPTAEMKSAFVQMCGGADTKGEVWVDFGAFGAMNLWTARGRPPGARPIGEMAKELWDEQGHPDYAVYLQEEDALLQRATAAAGMDRWWMPAVANDGRMMTTVLWPSLKGGRTGMIDEMGGTLCARATLCAKKGDFAGFKRDVLAVKGLGRQVASGPAMIQRMTGATLDRRANGAIGAAANGAMFTAAQWKELAEALDGLPAIGDMSPAVDVTERWAMLDNAETIAVGKGAEFEESIGNGRAGKIEGKEVDWDEALVRINGTYDEVVKGMKVEKLREMHKALLPVGKRLLAARESSLLDHESLKKGAGESREEYTRRMADAIMGMWSTAGVMATVETKHREAALEDGMARALVAAAWFKADKGKWPVGLDELVPGYLMEVPRDMYGEGAAVNYVVGHRGAQVYSLGPNGVDDAGLHNGDDGTDDVGVGG